MSSNAMEQNQDFQRMLMSRQVITRMSSTVFLFGFIVVGAVAESLFSCPKVIFSFGDSLTDTGNIEYLGLDLLRYPYGQSYFFPGSINPSRFSDGRLVIDFFAQAFGIPFVEPIAAKFPAGRGSGYGYGANFAYGGATAASDLKLTSVSLSSEIKQFFCFRSESTIPYVDPSYFGNALYVMSEIGANDFINAYSRGLTPSQVTRVTVPAAVDAIRNAMESLYAGGSRSFFVFNTPPEGCTPNFLTKFGEQGRPMDGLGCLREYNEVVKVYNAQLKATVTEYRRRWLDASLLLFDVYGASEAVYSDPEAYGMQKDKALVACCGYGGQYNYNPSVRCGTSGQVVDPATNVTTFVNISAACDNPSQYLNWDGLHPTESMNRQIALFFLTDRFVEGPENSTNLSLLCNLSFTDF